MQTCAHMCMGVGAAVRIRERFDICVEMCVGKRVRMCADICAAMRAAMRVDVCAAMCVDMCAYLGEALDLEHDEYRLDWPASLWPGFMLNGPCLCEALDLEHDERDRVDPLSVNALHLLVMAY